MPLLSPEEFARRALELEWLLTDVDGVLTDGGLYYDRRGHTLLKFNAKDGQGLKLAQRAGLKVGLLSGRSGGAFDRRAADLGLDVAIGGVSDKGAAFEEFLDKHQTEPARVAYAGDDLPDLTVLGRCGLAFAPADAVAEVRAVAHHELTARGGAGAVREMVEILLEARGEWQQAYTRFTFDRG